MDQDDGNIPPWAVGLQRKGNYYEGTVEDVDGILLLHKQLTVTTFGTRRSGSVSSQPDGRKIFWKQTVGTFEVQFDEIPFQLVAVRKMDCQYGEHYFRPRERTSKRVCTKSTRKSGCKAQIIIKEYRLYPDYQIDSTNLKVSQLRKLKSTKNQEILQALKNGSSVNTETRYYVSLPINAAHSGVRHTGRARGMSQRVDPLVSKFVEEIVRGGTTDVDTVQKLLKSRIAIELKHSLPDVMDRAFNPTKDDIRNHIHCAMRAIELSKFDQENLQKKVNVEQSLSTRKQYFRPFVKSSDSAEVEEQFSQRLLWVHQEDWQQKLCVKYGNTISLIDATYKTTKYDLPLFFVCVRTNVGYCVVTEFVVQDENAQQILEAPTILRGWNPDWNPPFFLCDYSEAEISALEQAFPGVIVYICDFHREQAWVRWVRAHKNGLTKEEGEKLLELLRDCAWAEGGDEVNMMKIDEKYKSAVKCLKDSSVWKKHDNVQGWLTSTWLCIPQRWARTFRDSSYHAAVETNNGTEALNRALKYSYLPRKASLTLTGIVRIIVDQFLPDMYQNYIFQNFKQLDCYRLLSSTVPEYLHGRPPSVVKHCLIRKTKSNRYPSDAIEYTGVHGKFHVMKDTKKHTVNFGSRNASTLACSCKDWKRWHLPCKHFFVIFRWIPQWDWDALPLEYKNSAYLSTDNSAIHEYLDKQGVLDSNDAPDPLNDSSDLPALSSSDASSSDGGNVVSNESVVMTSDGLKDPLPTKRVSKPTTEQEMVKARITLKNLENLTFNFPNDESLSKEFSEQLSKLFHTFYSKLTPETGILIRPVTKQRLQLIKRKYRKLKFPTWKISSLPKSVKKRKKTKKILKRTGTSTTFTNGVMVSRLTSANTSGNGSATANTSAVTATNHVTSKAMAEASSSNMLKFDSSIVSGVEANSARVLPSSSTKVRVGKKRSHRCGECSGCQTKDCMECTNCMDKVKYGGPGKKKQCCKQRKCLQDSIQKCDTAMETTVDTTTEATVNNTATVAAENHVAIVNASNDDKWVDLQCHDWWKLQPHLKQKVYNLWRKASKLQLGTWGVSTLSDSDINSLFPGNWLTDKVIMAFLKVASNIVEEMEKVKTFTVSTFLLSSINHNVDLARSWYRNIDMEQFDIWLLPMNVNDNHWILMVLRIYSHEMLIYDSLGHSNIGHVSKIKEWLSSHSVQHWKEVEATLDPAVPKQQNGYDCGVFTCIYAIHEMMKARKFLVNQGNTHDVREFITWTLMEFYNSDSV